LRSALFEQLNGGDDSEYLLLYIRAAFFCLSLPGLDREAYTIAALHFVPLILTLLMAALFPTLLHP
jgi:hypothetical protein